MPQRAEPMTERSRYRPATELAHPGRDPRRYLGAVNTPVFRASTILLPTVADLERAARGEYPGLSYGLHGLPTVTDFQRALADARRRARGARGSVGPDRDDAAAARVAEARRSRARDRRRLRPDAPLLRQPPAPPRHRRRATTIRWRRRDRRRVPAEHDARVRRIAGLADVRGAGHSARSPRPRMRAARGSSLDNTWATPLGFRAFDHGVDVSVHAATKYIGGHSDVLLGAIVANAATFPALHRLWTDMGVTPSSDDCFLGLRGLRTLGVRLQRHEAERARNRDVAARAAGSARSALSGAAGRSRARAVEARFPRRVGTVRRRAAAGRRRRASRACSTACGSSAWAGAGAASRAC